MRRVWVCEGRTCQVSINWVSSLIHPVWSFHVITSTEVIPLGRLSPGPFPSDGASIFTKAGRRVSSRKSVWLVDLTAALALEFNHSGPGRITAASWFTDSQLSAMQQECEMAALPGKCLHDLNWAEAPSVYNWLYSCLILKPLINSAAMSWNGGISSLHSQIDAAC